MPESIERQPPNGVLVLCYLTCAVVWSTTWFVIRESIAHDGQPGFPPYLASALRFTLATAVLFAVVWIRPFHPKPRTRRQYGWLISAGIVNGFGYVLVYTAEQTLPGGLMAVLFGTVPLMTAVATTVLGMERVVAAQVWSALVALAGIVIISWHGIDVADGYGFALAAALLAVVSATVYSVLAKYSMRDVHPLAGTTVFIAATTVITWIPAAGEVGQMPWPPPATPAVATLYLAIFGSVIAFACFFYLVKHVSLMTANSLVLVQPVLALLIDSALERHVRLAPGTWWGVAVTLTAVVIGIVFRPRPPVAREAA